MAGERFRGRLACVQEAEPEHTVGRVSECLRGDGPDALRGTLNPG